MASVFKRDHAKGPGTEPGSSTSTETDRGIKMSAKGQADSYMECYPDEYEMYTAIGGDSDDEADFSKMDLGNKKGPIRRWDFDNPDEYEAYMSNREALPKAAFQYGVKMNDGRKTRKVGGPKTEQQEKQKLDKEWDQISRLELRDVIHVKPPRISKNNDSNKDGHDKEPAIGTHIKEKISGRWRERRS